MASIRKLKKNLAYIFKDFIEDVYFMIDIYPSKELLLNDLIDDIINKYKNTIYLIYHPDLKYKPSAFSKNPLNKKLRNKSHAKKINETVVDFMQYTSDLYNKIDEIVSKD